LNTFKKSLLIGDESDKESIKRFAVPPFTREDIKSIVISVADQQGLDFRATYKTGKHSDAEKAEADEALQTVLLMMLMPTPTLYLCFRWRCLSYMKKGNMTVTME